MKQSFLYALFLFALLPIPSAFAVTATPTIEPVTGLTNVRVISLKALGRDFFAGTQDHGMFRSTDDARSWQPVGKGLPEKYSVVGFASIDDVLFADLFEGQLYRSGDHGLNWVRVDSGITANATTGFLSYHLAALGGRLFYGRLFDRIWCSNDMGKSWRTAEDGLPRNFSGFAGGFAVMDSALYAAYDSGKYYRMGMNGTRWKMLARQDLVGPLFSGKADDFGFKADQREIHTPPKNPLAGLKCAASRGSIVVLGTEKGVYVSRDGGMNWAPSNAGLPVEMVFLNVNSECGALSVKTNEYRGDGYDWGYYKSEDNGASWSMLGWVDREVDMHASIKLGGECLNASDAGLSYAAYGSTGTPLEGPVYTLALTDRRLWAGTGTGAYFSVDKGATWGAVPGLRAKTAVRALVATEKGTLFAGTDRGVFALEKGAKKWLAYNTGFKRGGIDRLLLHNDTLLALFHYTIEGVDEGEGGGPWSKTIYQVYRRASDGQEWSSIAPKVFDTVTVTAFAASGASVFVGTGSELIYSNDFGDSWVRTRIGLPEESGEIFGMAINNGYVFMGLGNGLFRMKMRQ
jgi:hypothetical protein